MFICHIIFIVKNAIQIQDLLTSNYFLFWMFRHQEELYGLELWYISNISVHNNGQFLCRAIFLYLPIQNWLRNLASQIHTMCSFWIFHTLATSSSLMRRLTCSHRLCRTWTTARYQCSCLPYTAIVFHIEWSTNLHYIIGKFVDRLACGKCAGRAAGRATNWPAIYRVTTHHTDNVKFPDNSVTFPWRFAALLPMLSVTHIMPVLVLLSVVG